MHSPNATIRPPKRGQQKRRSGMAGKFLLIYEYILYFTLAASGQFTARARATARPEQTTKKVRYFDVFC